MNICLIAQSLTNCELSAWNPGCFLHSCHNPNCVSRYVYNLQIAIAFNAYGKRHQESIAMPYNAENTTALQADRYEQCRDTLIYDCAGALNWPTSHRIQVRQRKRHIMSYYLVLSDLVLCLEIIERSLGFFSFSPVVLPL